MFAIHCLRSLTNHLIVGSIDSMQSVSGFNSSSSIARVMLPASEYPTSPIRLGLWIGLIQARPDPTVVVARRLACRIRWLRVNGHVLSVERSVGVAVSA